MIDLDDLEKLCNAATPGKWVQGDPENWLIYEAKHPKSEVMMGHLLAVCDPKANWSYGMTTCCRNAAFIAAARTAVPELIAEVRRLRAISPFKITCDRCNRTIVPIEIESSNE